MSKKEKGVTLAICTHNGASRLSTTIEHILRQEIKKDIAWELLIIDNASSDNSAPFAKGIWPKDRADQLRIVLEEKLGAIHARNRAIKEAQYSYLSYIDDDNWITSNWVVEVFRIFEKFPSVGLISCPSQAHLSESPPDYFDGIKGWLAVGTRFEQEGIIIDRPVSFWTAGLSLRLEAFSVLAESKYTPCLMGRTGKKTYGGEDHELCFALILMGWDVYYSHQISFIHDIPPVRLTSNYLERLIINSVKSKAILDIYRAEYLKKPLLYPYLSIFSYTKILIDRALRFWLKASLGLIKKPLSPNRLGYLYSLGCVQGYFIHLGCIAQARQNIVILKSFRRKPSVPCPAE